MSKNLWMRENFFSQFYSELSRHPTHEQAYEAVEAECERQNGRRKYADYQSFRQVLRRFIQSQRKR